MTTDSFDLSKYPVHLGLGATIVPQEEFTGGHAWYEHYGAGVAADGAEGRLVAIHSFSEPWSTWEMHPHGHELVVCIAGRIVLHQERPEGLASITLEANQAAINPPGVWHTADVESVATALFITAGMGTEIRER